MIASNQLHISPFYPHENPAAAISKALEIPRHYFIYYRLIGTLLCRFLSTAICLWLDIGHWTATVLCPLCRIIGPHRHAASQSTREWIECTHKKSSLSWASFIVFVRIHERAQILIRRSCAHCFPPKWQSDIVVKRSGDTIHAMHAH